MGDVTVAERLDRVAFWLTVGAVGVAVVLLAAHTVPNPNVTWDEAGQYWMTQGQAFGTPWGTEPGTLWAGLDLGRHGNILDPVGFTMVLWAWVWLFGSDPATLRALPFVFFVGTLVVSYLLGRRCMGTYRTPALVLPAAVLTTYVSLQWATEIRPYSAELMGVVAVAAATLWFLKRPTWPAMLALSGVIVFFTLATRYAFALAAGAAMLTVLLVMWRAHELGAHWRKVALGFGVLVAVAAFLVWNLGLLDSGDQVWDDYGNPIRVESITDFEHMRMLLQINFVYGWHKLTGAFLLLGLVGWFLAHFGQRFRALAGLGGALAARGRLWIPAWVFVGVYEAASAFASQMGWTQWNAEFRHSIGLIGAAIVSGLGIVVLGQAALDGIWRPLAGRMGTGIARVVRWIGWVVWGAVLFGLLAMSVRVYADFRRTDIETLGVTVPTRVSAALAGEEDVRWLVDTQLFPSLRYLVEASGLPLGTLSISEATPFGLYGHDDAKLLAWMREAALCSPGQTTAALIANSVDTNAAVYEELARELTSKGCTLTPVELSDVESLVVVR